MKKRTDGMKTGEEEIMNNFNFILECCIKV